LEGAAQKLITVRSALKLHNRLDNPVLLKMEHLFGHLNIREWPDAKSEIVVAGQVFSVPLSHVHAFLYVKPLQSINLDPEALSQAVEATGHQKFDGTEYWNKYETLDSSRSSFRGSSGGGGNSNTFQFSDRSFHWKEMVDNAEAQQELRTCRGNRDKHYRLVVAIRKDGYPSKDGPSIPGHTLTLWPPLRLHNLLPCDLLFKIPGTETKGRISSAKTATLNEIDLEKPVELNVTLDSYPGAGQIQIPQGLLGSFETELRLMDVNKRVLQLKASIQVLKSSGIQITVAAPFWLINRTGLPLIFRQEGVSHESAGQFSENEQARQVSPFMYSFSDPDGSPALIVRLGKRYGNNPPWCQPFNLHKDILHRQLKSSSTNETFIIGIEVRRGRGRYSQTTIVTFSPRFQLYNQSSYKIQIAQKCFARAMVSLRGEQV
jgi:vacuolar protein sorting-associated protein 13D